MSNYIDFYFDIISPYSYLAHKKIQKIKENQKVVFDYKPILLGGLHNLAGIMLLLSINIRSKICKVTVN